MIKISRSFIKGSALYTLVGALPMASAVLLLPFYISHLTTTLFGALSLHLAFSLLIQLLVTLSFDSSIFIHYHEYKNDREKLATFIGSAFALMIIVGVSLFALGATIGNLVFSLLFSDIGVAFFPNGWLAMAGGIFQALVKVHSSLLQSREKQETYFWSNLLLFGAIFLFTLAGLYAFPSSLIGPLAGRALALGLATVWVASRIVKEFDIRVNFNILRQSFEFNLYSFIYQLQQWVINYFDRVLMLLYLPLASVGVYDFAIKCMLGVELFMNGLHSAFVPKVVKIMADQPSKGTTNEVNRYYHGFIALTMLVICASIWLVPLAIGWLSDYLEKPDYKQSMSIIPYIAVLYAGRSVRLYFGLPYSILKYTKPLPLIYTAITIVKIAGILLVASKIGVMGVVLASAASIVVEILMLYLFSKKRFQFRFNRNKILLAPLLLVAAIVVFESISTSHQNLLHAGYCVFCIVVLLTIYRTELKNIRPFDLIKK